MTTPAADPKDPDDASSTLSLSIPLPDLTRTIKARLAYHGRTASWLAEQLGISATSVSHRMSGRIAWTQAELEVVSDVLDVPLGNLAPVLSMLPRARHLVVGGPLDDVLAVLDAAAPGATLGQLDAQDAR